MSCEYDGHWWFGNVQERQDHIFYIKFMQPHGPNSNFFWLQRDDCCWTKDNNILLVITFHQYYPTLRRNIRVGVLIDLILTTHMNVPGMEPKYASGKEAHVLINYI
jgi:hypothetical protein